MQDPGVTGLPDHNHDDQGILSGLDRKSTPPLDETDLPNGHDGNDGPPLKRRKVSDATHTQKASPRPISPPWKRIVAEGPTSFIQGGRRKSGRTNAVPLELQPHTARRQTRAAFDKTTGDQKYSRPSYSLAKKKAPVDFSQPKVAGTEVIKRGPGRPPKNRNPEAAILIKKERSSTYQNGVIPLPNLPTARGRKPKTQTHRTQSFGHGNDAETLESLIQQLNGLVKHESDSSAEDSDIAASPSQRSPSPPLTLQKVTFKVRLPKPTIATPANIPPPKRYSTLDEFLRYDENEPRLGQDNLTPDQIHREAMIRRRVREAQRPGRLLDKNIWKSLPDKQEEPKKQYAHHDHLLAHVARFRTLLRAERKDHKRKAELLANEAKRYVEDKRKRNKVKTKEELEQEVWERFRSVYRRVVKDVDKLWDAVRSEVDAARQKEYEEQQQAQMKGHLARVLDRTDQMLNRSIDIDDSLISSDEDVDATSQLSGETSEDSEQMSDSDSESSSDAEPDDPDAGMTVDELRLKYESIPELETASVDAKMELDSNIESEASETVAADDSDPETEMDSEFDTEESEDASDEDVGESDADDSRGGLLSLFSKKEIAEMGPEDDATSHGTDPDESAQSSEAEAPLIGEGMSDSVANDNEILESHDTPDNDAMELDGLIPEHAALANQLNEAMHQAHPMPHRQGSSDERMSQEPSTEASPHTSATKASEPESVSSFEDHAQAPAPTTPSQPRSPDIKTPVPSLLRGTLREYQHEGLDWLANLYENGRSGILADEMGLGKTIQSIAVLAHLAEVHEVWGPHLIVVPTSVMLNWEMEFKKFLPGFKILTYYGNLEERKQKRRGWMADDSFNVCITSYQLVLQDANSFKRRRWHYMILDEAHNIKNFRSERWQTMMTFNTRARLLLTGTPLQNNLTELWSLLFFLHYGQENEGEDDAFAGLKVWSEWFKKPVESILEHGRQVLDEEDKEQVSKLHKVIRPFLLRRLKRDVEKQMPLKYEHVELCRLSKRQRQLYDGFMSRAQTKETLASGNYLSIINALMQLRKVCNHPDLFETRPINTSFAMPKSVAAEYEIRDLLIRRRVSRESIGCIDLDFLQLAPISCEKMSMIEFILTSRKHAYHQLKGLRDNQLRRIGADKSWHGEQRVGVLASLENVGRRARLNELDRTLYYEAYRHHQHPVYGRELLKKLSIDIKYDTLSRLSNKKTMTRQWEQYKPLMTLDLVQSIQDRSEQMEPFVQQYGCITPAVVATDLSMTAVTDAGAAVIRQSPVASYPDPFHEARMKLSIAFPDKRLLQYDCGKLQRLDQLLRKLQAGGHRALIFTQMTKVLDILEQFLNIHGHRYLRLDGATKIEQRQILTDRFNNDTRILAFILSSRSGGLGINLTGADTVIFYDLDWNPAMDKQCTDRAHRIGQTRDVHIYRFVSEHTIESNILRKASQKQMLDDVVIQEGDFTTDYVNKLSYRDMLDENAENDVAGAAMDRVLGNDKQNMSAFEHAEDREDIAAAKVAAREVQHADDGDFEDKAIATPQSSHVHTPGPFAATDAALAEADVDSAENRSIDDYMVSIQKYLMKDVPLGPPKDRRKKGKKRRDEHRVRRAR